MAEQPVEQRPRKRQAIAPGIILILIGAWALLQSMGYEWARMDQFWPVILIIGGLISLVTGVLRTPRDPDSAWFSTVAILCGALFLYITIGPGEWEALSYLWPAFPLIGGIGWLAAWLVDLRKISHLALAIVAAVVGAIGFMYTYNRIGTANAARIASLWPLVLVVIGAGLIAQYLLQRRGQ